MNEERNLIMRARAQRVCEYDYTTQAEDWTEDKLAQELADTIERLIRERDEARSFAAHYVKSLTDEAEQRGYRRGVEDAAKVAKTHGVYPHLNVYAGGPEWYQHGQKIAAAILALMEQTGDTNSPNLESGAGRSAKRE